MTYMHLIKCYDKVAAKFDCSVDKLKALIAYADFVILRPVFLHIQAPPEAVYVFGQMFEDWLEATTDVDLQMLFKLFPAMPFKFQIVGE
jgi:hypothetical protein